MITLPDLPFNKKALEPFISEETLNYHYGKHHKTYVDKLNLLIKDTKFSDSSLEDIILASEGAVFNNAAQVWNHSFYWDCLSEEHHQEPSSILKSAIEKHFDSYEAFVTEFSSRAGGIFGSGWCWLVLDPEDFSLKIHETSNAGTPLTQNLIPLLTCDVWEHAYYLDTQNQRPKYLENFWAVVNWKLISARYQEHIGNTHG